MESGVLTSKQPGRQSPRGKALRALAARLRAIREEAGLSGIELSQAIGHGWRQSKISKLENGHRLPTAKEVTAWAAAVNVDPEPLLALHSKASAEYSAWQNRFAAAGSVVALQDEISALETSSRFLVTYQPAMVPGRLQTPAYMREMASGDEFLADDISEDDLSMLFAAKIRRQSILYEPGRRIIHIVGEAALRTRIGAISRSTMGDQLSHLIEVATLPGHEFAVVTFDAVTPIAPASGFSMYDRDLVIIEALVGDLQITDPTAIARYSRWTDQLLEVARTGNEAIEFCRSVQEDS